VEQGVPFFCVPVGTRNHFALDLGLDRDDPLAALDAFRNGEEILIDYGRPGVCHPAVVVSAQRILDAGPNVVQLVPLTTTNARAPPNGSKIPHPYPRNRRLKERTQRHGREARGGNDSTQ
jgi:hypothetical protein